jgi:hypothetical protein
MAVNQKPVYATMHLLHNSRIPIEPGTRIDERMPADLITSLLERGEATDDPQLAGIAEQSEAERQVQVAEEIETRSEKRGKSAA